MRRNIRRKPWDVLGLSSQLELLYIGPQEGWFNTHDILTSQNHLVRTVHGCPDMACQRTHETGDARLTRPPMAGGIAILRNRTIGALSLSLRIGC